MVVVVVGGGVAEEVGNLASRQRGHLSHVTKTNTVTHRKNSICH